MSTLDRAEEARASRVHAVLSAARRIANREDPLGREARKLLPAATGLSEAGVELGLCRHMETQVSAVDLECLIARAGSAGRVHVLLSANVFVGAVRAVALAAAAAPKVCVRASRREDVMTGLLWRALNCGGDPWFELVDELSPSNGDHVHVYGRDETVAAVARSVPPGVQVRGHGAGIGVALVDLLAHPAVSAAQALSWDVVAFDQRGCLSPRVVFVAGSPADAATFASALAHELKHRHRDVPRGRLSAEESQAALLYTRTVQAVGHADVGLSFVVGLDPDPRALALPPPGRHVHIVPISRPEQLHGLLGPWASVVTAVGCAKDREDRSNLARELRSIVPLARWSSLGAMQSPPLDGPVDLRGVL